MPSPFPGMNPYLEQPDAWHDFHERFMPAAADVIGAQVLPRYFVKIDEHVYIHEPEEDARRLLGRADVQVIKTEDSARVGMPTAVLDAPAQVWQPIVDVERLAFLEIRDRNTRQVITVVELLSPCNKQPGDDRDQFLLKWNQLLKSGTNLVEIDLLRGGPRMPWEKMPPCDYCVTVSCTWERPRAGFWPIRLRDRLPTIPIPLRAGEPPARLDLQALVHRIYDAAGYLVYVYDGQPEPALPPEDAAWARQLLPARG